MHSCVGEGNGNPPQYSCLENPKDRGAWWAAVYGVAQSHTRLMRLSSSSPSQGMFATQGSNPGLLHCRLILYCLSHQGAQEYWSGQPTPSPADLPNPGIEPGWPALQVGSLPAELPGKPGESLNEF